MRGRRCREPPLLLPHPSLAAVPVPQALLHQLMAALVKTQSTTLAPSPGLEPVRLTIKQ